MPASDSSTQRLSDHIDQLDVALDQLAVADRNFDRFALMPVDNVVELILHDFAQDRARQRTRGDDHRPLQDRTDPDFHYKRVAGEVARVLDQESQVTIGPIDSLRHIRSEIANQVLGHRSSDFSKPPEGTIHCYLRFKDVRPRKVSAVHPICAASDPIAAHCDAYSFSNTMRTARSRTSGEYLVDFLIAPSSQEMEPPEKPCRFNRLSTLKGDKDYHKALTRYYDFMSQTDELRSQLHGAAADLDMAIQNQIDIARGK